MTPILEAAGSLQNRCAESARMLNANAVEGAFPAASTSERVGRLMGPAAKCSDGGEQFRGLDRLCDMRHETRPEGADPVFGARERR